MTVSHQTNAQPNEPLSWADFNIIECKSLEHLLSQPIQPLGKYPAVAEQRGLICPIPPEIKINDSIIAHWHDAMVAHPKYKEYQTNIDDHVRGVELTQAEVEKCEDLPEALIKLSGMLKSTFEHATPKQMHESATAFFRRNSTHHTRPETHYPAATASLEGATTVIYKMSALGKTLEKKSLPPRSIAVLNNMHSAPKMSDEGDNRMNVIYVPGGV